ncbi:hypothetical protein ACFFV7_41920 [Nonomuraea spiralis]|uniref:Tyr recombinase domain-containing protein n=1 Tax=Nonomuraea spiralis TaxID=46182 RepID=A0ABV5IV66_9ACTN|nr:hypothetical protein [Nonomuraea spiralis]GGT30542.1 hypothetical protein GCM10010176_088900 [Nonomuraea spiralis]
MLSAARAQEVLALDVDELDLRNRRARVRRTGGAVDVVVRQTATARLLPRLLDGRRGGPSSSPAVPPASNSRPATSTQARTGARLSYRRAAELFETATTDIRGAIGIRRNRAAGVIADH